MQIANLMKGRHTTTEAETVSHIIPRTKSLSAGFSQIHAELRMRVLAWLWEHALVAMLDVFTYTLKCASTAHAALCEWSLFMHKRMWAAVGYKRTHAARTLCEWKSSFRLW